MDSNDVGYIKEYMEIPAIFHCYTTKKAFEHCLTCKRQLLADGVQYIIEKAIRRYPGFKVTDVVSEYAICLDCHEKLQKTLSADSKRVINDYFEQRVDLYKRRQQLMQEKGTHLDAWLNNCLIYHTPQDQLTDYQIYAQCEGRYLLFAYMPFLISGQAIDEIASLLSAETKDFLDNFIEQHFGLPPEFIDIFKNRKVILL